MGEVSDPISVSAVPLEGSGACGMEEQGRLRRGAGGFPSGFATKENNVVYLSAQWSKLRSRWVTDKHLTASLSSLCRSNCASPLMRDSCPQCRRQGYPGLLPFRHPAVSPGMECGCLGGWLTRVRGTELSSASFDSSFSIAGFKRKIQTMGVFSGKEKKKKIIQDEDIWIHGSSHKHNSFPLPPRKISTQPGTWHASSVSKVPLWQHVSFRLLHSVLKPFQGHCYGCDSECFILQE